MIVCITRNSIKRAAVGIIALAGIIWGISELKGQDDVLQSVSTMADTSLSQDLDTVDKQVSLLKALGWEIDEKPINKKEVQIPKEFDEVYKEYNEIQKKQGLDLEKYKGKRAMLYVYNVKNEESGTQNVTANIVIYGKKLIAADICVPEENGLIRTIIDLQANSEDT